MKVTRVMGSQFLHSWTSGGAQRIFLFKLMLSTCREVPISANLYGVPQICFSLVSCFPYVVSCHFQLTQPLVGALGIGFLV